MKFEQLKVWQDSFDLAVEVYRAFSSVRDYGFCDQVRRSAVSVPSNISEGLERETNKEVIRFLYYAKGSAGELYTQLAIAQQLQYIDRDSATRLKNKAQEVSRMLGGFIKYRKESGWSV